MTVEDKNQYKLMILYMLKRAQFRLSNTQIVAFFQEMNYLDYFNTQAILSEMLDTKLIEMNKSKIKSLYSLQEAGYECIKYFEQDIKKDAIENINNYLSENKIKMKEESNCLADFSEGKNFTYDTHLEILEGRDSLFSININVPDAETARMICENWKENSQTIYKFIIKKLLG